MRIEAVAAILAMATVAAQGSERKLVTVVVAEKQTVRLGDPIKVSVRLANQAPQAVEVNGSAAGFGCFEVIDPDGHALPYVGFDGQIPTKPVRVQPSSTVTIAEALDLTDKYIFQKAGRYSIRFTEEGTGLPGSPTIMVDVTMPGQLSEFDQLASFLLPVCPKGWHLAKDGRGEVGPFGRSRVAGFALHVCHNHMRGEAVLLWFTKPEAKIDPEQKPQVTSEYLGRARSLYVYATVGSNTPPLWPTATADICRGLQVAKE